MKKIIFTIITFLTLISVAHAENGNLVLREEVLDGNKITRIYSDETNKTQLFEIVIPSDLKTDLELKTLANVKKALTLYYKEKGYSDDLYILNTGYNPNINKDVEINMSLYNKMYEQSKAANTYADKTILEKKAEAKKRAILKKRSNADSVKPEEVLKEEKSEDKEEEKAEVKVEKMPKEVSIETEKEVKKETEWTPFFGILGGLILASLILLIWKRKWFFS